MTFIDLFSGIGGFRRGMELAGHKCMGFCEINKFAVASYTSMHCMTDEDRAQIATLPKRSRITEANKEVYRHGEWFRRDITTVKASEIPTVDCWCFGFPCQDISAVGEQQGGIQGKRSGLFFRIIQLLGETRKENQPSYLFIENVTNLFSINGGWDFYTLLSQLDKIGYDAEWHTINANRFVPQSRERIFIIGLHRGKCTRKIPFITGSNRQTHRYEITEKLPSLCDMGHDKQFAFTNIARCLTARYYKGATNRANEYSGVAIEYDKKYNCGKVYDKTYSRYIAFRTLTPKECFRLQGWTDEYFYRAELVSSNTQLYVQAGNGVTVPVIYEIAKHLKL